MAAIVGLWFAVAGGQSQANAETRTLSFYFGHTKETITVTYKRNGSYDKKGLKKLNWFFRDWRRNVSTRMDPELFDLIWEVKTELRAKKPIHVISGFRSARTNSKLRRMGRKVARRSQHIQGRAIDLYFPDVPLVKLRNAALVRERGGVGYYPRSGSKGFVHVDTGTVRHWPRMSRKRLAKIFRNHKKKLRNAPAPVYIAKRKKKNNTKQSAPRIALAKPRVKPSIKKPAVYAALSSKARAALTAQIAKSNVPMPRPKPYAILAELQGQRDVTIQPASANAQVTNFATKRNADEARRVGTLNNLPLDIRPQESLRSAFIAAAPVMDDPVPSLWSATRRPALFETSELRYGAAPQPAKQNLHSGPIVLGSTALRVASADGSLPAPLVAPKVKRERTFTDAEMVRIRAQQVNRNGKTNLVQTPAVRKMRPTIKPLSKQAQLEHRRMEAIAIQARPLSFD